MGLTMSIQISETGRRIFGLSILGYGVQQIYFHTMLPLLIPSWPSWIPGYLFWVYLLVAILLPAGLFLIIGFRVRTVSMVLAGLFLLLFLGFHIPYQYSKAPRSLLYWADAITILALAGCCSILVFSPRVGDKPDSASLTWDRVGRACFSFMLILFGSEHFLFTAFVSTLVPRWVPFPVVWTYLAGAALIGAGVAIILNLGLRWVGLALGGMLFLWVLFLHIPRAITDPSSNFGAEWSSVLEALGFGGVALYLAGRDPKSERKV